MSIVSDKKFLTDEEKQTLKKIQLDTQTLILELGEIEMIKLQLEGRQEGTRRFLAEITTQEKTFTSSLFEKYGKVSIDPETGEIIQVG
jgi:hypothetical protein